MSLLSRLARVSREVANRGCIAVLAFDEEKINTINCLIERKIKKSSRVKVEEKKKRATRPNLDMKGTWPKMDQHQQTSRPILDGTLFAVDAVVCCMCNHDS